MLHCLIRQNSSSSFGLGQLWARPRSRRHVAVERRPGDPKRLANVIDGIVGIGVELLQHGELLGIPQSLWSPPETAARSGGAEARLGAFPNQIPLEFG